MKKAFWLAVFCVFLMSSHAAADTLDILKPVWLHALENMQEEEGGPIAEPAVVSTDDQLEVVRSAVYMRDEYETEAYVYAELRNTGDRVIRVSGAELTVLDAAGKQLSKREYASAKPDVIMPGESLFVAEWLYDFVGDLSRVHTICVTIERSEYGRKQIERMPQARAYVDNGYLCAELTNTTDEPVFEAGVTAVAVDTNGKILDILREETYSGLGIAPGSTIILRKYLEQHAADAADVHCEAHGYVYSE